VKKKVHYAGSIQYKAKKGPIVTIAPGFAACCTGDRAQKIALEGMHTYRTTNVTCAHCQKLIERHRAYLKTKKDVESKVEYDLELYARQHLFGKPPTPKEWTLN
jgi:hypothetical protein